MSLEENELTVEIPCKKCDGFGFVKVVMMEGRKFFIICDRCYGRRQIDWVSAIFGINFDDAFTFIAELQKNLFPGNFIMYAPGRNYIIKREFFYETDIKEKYKYLLMTTFDPLERHSKLVMEALQ